MLHEKREQTLELLKPMLDKLPDEAGTAEAPDPLLLATEMARAKEGLRGAGAVADAALLRQVA